MDISVIIAFCAALFAASLALGVGFSTKTLPRWLFLAGMLLLSAESLFVGLTLDSVLPQQAVQWQQWRLAVLSLLPGAWLLFSLVYARENRMSVVTRTRCQFCS